MFASNAHAHSVDAEVSAGTVLPSYTDELTRCREELRQVQSNRLRAVVATICSFLVFVALITYLLLLQAKVFIALALLPGYATFHLFQMYRRAGEKWASFDAQCDYFERGIWRLTDKWQGAGRQGLEFGRADHLYQEDLNILGPGSLFELLCTTRSSAGASRLASYLLDPVSLEETHRRQQCVLELRDAQHLRQKLHHFGRYSFQDCSESVFDDWFALPTLHMPFVIPLLMLAASVTSLLLGMGIYFGPIAWASWGSLFVAIVVLQASLGLFCLRIIRPRLRLLLQLTESFTVLREGLGVMEGQHFESPKLKELVARVRLQHASTIVGKVEQLFRLLEQREKREFYLLACFLVVGTQGVLAIERWRSHYQDSFKSWLDAWAEFEALLALSGYAYEQKESTFPEVIEGPPSLRAIQLGHPLLAADKYIGNDVVLDDSARLYIISGSNMAGKSTFLRTIGLNSVLAMAGAPVRAASARFSALTVCASLAPSDSLLEGKSKFLAEVEKIRNTLACARSGKPVLFLIDEMLSGTNSQDRRASAEIIIEALLAEGAIGALSTHDLALIGITANPAIAATLVHMASLSADRPLEFDYRLHPGVARHTNALAIVRMMGITMPRVDV
jgi:hypothetical protein